MRRDAIKMILDLKQFDFSEKDDSIRVFFLKTFYFDVDKEEFLERMSCRIRDGKIDTSLDEESARDVFGDIFSDGLENLRHKITGKKTIYIHRNSGVPLIGSGAIGIVDRNTSIIEVKPITGCNLKCIYCSLSEGGEEIENEFLIDADYMFEELKKVIEYKTERPEDRDIKFEIHIGTHGEPLLYFDIAYFARLVRSIKNVNRISVNTNAMLLSKEYAKELIDSGINRFNISINSLDPKNSRDISGTEFYDVKKVMGLIDYLDSLQRSGKYPDLEYTLAPVMMKNINTADVEEMIRWSREKGLGARYGIQNFLVYKTGRKPVAMLDFRKFFALLGEWEKKYDAHLILNESDFNIVKTRELPKVAKTDEHIVCEYLFRGRRDCEYLAKYEGRLVTIEDEKHELKNLKPGQMIPVKIVRTKHNIYDAVPAKDPKKSHSSNSGHSSHSCKSCRR